MLNRIFLGVVAIGMGVFTMSQTPGAKAQGSLIQIQEAYYSGLHGGTPNRVMYGDTDVLTSWSTGAFWEGEIPTGIPGGWYFNVKTSMNWENLGVWDYGQGAPVSIYDDGSSGTYLGEILLLVDELTGTGLSRVIVTDPSIQETSFDGFLEALYTTD